MWIVPSRTVQTWHDLFFCFFVFFFNSVAPIKKSFSTIFHRWRKKNTKILLAKLFPPVLKSQERSDFKTLTWIISAAQWVILLFIRKVQFAYLSTFTWRLVRSTGLFQITCTLAGWQMKPGGGATKLQTSGTVSQKPSVLTGSHRNTHILLHLSPVDLNVTRDTDQSVHSLQLLLIMTPQTVKPLHRSTVICVHGSTSILHQFSRKSASYQFTAVHLSKPVRLRQHWEIHQLSNTKQRNKEKQNKTRL